MSQVIAFFNFKGGASKTTSVYNIAAALSIVHGKKVLLIDVDPQGNSSYALGLTIWELKTQLLDVLWRKIPAQDAIYPTDSGVDVIPSNILLAEDEIPLTGQYGRELLLKETVVDQVAQNYDFVLIDCPPNIGIFSINALMAANQVIIPVDTSDLGLLGIAGIGRTLSIIRTHLKHHIEVLGVIVAKYAANTKISKSVLAELKTHFGEKVFETTIPDSTKFKEAPSNSLAIFQYAPKSKGAEAYLSLTQEILNRVYAQTYATV